MRLLSRLFGWLLSWGVDRYAHMSLAMVIASVMLVAFCWLTWWASLAISVLITLACIVVKDFVIDANADMVDVIFGVGGAAFPCIVWIVANVI
ncbi:MAG: hypothetical protein IKY13_07020 [Bacteroidaceae bacterium]|nr:hypothetical protein [Bacteroidaceae bacterium]